MNNLLTKISLLILGILVIGFVFIDNNPFGSKTLTNNGDQIQPVKTYTDNPPVYTDNFDGANDTTSLKARGYKVWYRGGGPQGATATWYQGQPSVFNAYNGPTSGYVAANYAVVNGTNNIDSWLVLPRLATGLLAGDSLYFWSRSPTASTFPDSIRVMYSVSDSIPEGTWTELGRFKVNTAGAWELRGFRAPTASINGRFAVRYCVVNGGPSGNNSDFIGIDAMNIIRSAQPPSLNQPDQWCSNFPAVPGSGSLWAHASVALGDTVYIAGDGAGLTSNMFRRYSISGNNWTTGTSMPGPKGGGDLVQCGGKIYYIGGGSSAFNTATPEQYVYNPATGTWTTIANIPTPVSGNVAESYNDSLIYCVAGGWTTYLTTVQVYSKNTNTWTTATPLPAGTGRRSYAGGLMAGKFYVCAGYSGTFRQDLVIGTINPSNPLSITWTTGPNLVIGTSRPGGTAIAGKFYVVIGETSLGADNRMGIYDTTTGAWTYVMPKPTPASNYWGVVSGSIVNCNGVMGVKIWVPGGSLSNSNRPLDVFADTCLTGCGPVGIVKNGNTIPDNFSLMQNYPNPFNPTTKIVYMLPKAADVNLVVYDLLGRQVTTLVSEHKLAGTYSVEFNASNYASGVYFYTIKSGDFTDTKKMVLIK